MRRARTKPLYQPLCLREFSLGAVCSSLGELAKSIQCRFSCGGTVSQADSIRLVYKKPSGDWSEFQLPADDNVNVQEFLDSCSTASFGIGSETVTDKKYRDALKLDPECFHTNFAVANTPILDHINTIMSLSSSIRAQLYKLNVYSIGGHFKSHVDTPRSEDMFGSLVVCLPSHFTGGELVTRHQARQVTFDWSTSTATHWAAFFSDVEHEVLPVTSGHRITLTYNLYHLSPIRGKMGVSWEDVISMCGVRPTYWNAHQLAVTLQKHHGQPYQFVGCTRQLKQILCREYLDQCDINGIIEAVDISVKQKLDLYPASLDVPGNPLYQELLAALQSPHFMRGGGTLGFYCQHKYTNISIDVADFYPLLKGEDAIVYRVCKSLGLPIALKPVLSYTSREDWQTGRKIKTIRELCDDYSKGNNYVIPRFRSHQVETGGFGPEQDIDEDDFLEKNLGGLLKVNDVNWCQGPEIFEPILSTIHYGNDAELTIYYQSAAFLVGVPKFTSRRGSIVTTPCDDCPPAKRRASETPLT